MSRSNWTGRVPRSMNDAFGPHCRRELNPIDSPDKPGEQIAGGVLILVGIIALAALLVHHLSK